MLLKPKRYYIFKCLSSTLATELRLSPQHLHIAIQGMGPDHATDSQPSQKTIPGHQAQVLVKWSREQDSATRKSAPKKASKVTPRIVRTTGGYVQEHALHYNQRTSMVYDNPDRRDHPMETGPALRVPSTISRIPSYAHDILVVERYGTKIDCISPPLLLFGVRQPAWSTNQTQSLVEEAVAYP